MVLFRADGNSEIGSGHIMRCLSIADAAKEQGIECRFVVADESFAQTIQNRGFACTALYTDYRSMEEEQDILFPFLQHNQPNAIVVDSYFVTADYLAWMGQFANVTYIDDLAAFPYPVKNLINYNIYGPDLEYEQLYQKAGLPTPRLLLGPDYTPLRKQFQNLPAHIPSRTVRNILISTGGADFYHVALRFAQYLIDWKPASQYNFHFIVGAMSQDFIALKEVADRYPWIILHWNVQDMAALMCQCDLAIAAAGSTLYELCACGVPTITYAFADNQLLGMEAFDKKDLMISAGDIRIMKSPISIFVNHMMQLIEDLEKRVAIVHNMQNVTVGMKTFCLAKAISEELY